MAAQDEREKEKKTPEENMKKFNSVHFKRKKNVTWNEASKEVRNMKESTKFLHE